MKPFYLKNCDYHTGNKKNQLFLYMRFIFKHKDTDTLKEKGQEIIQHANTNLKKKQWGYIDIRQSRHVFWFKDRIINRNKGENS